MYEEPLKCTSGSVSILYLRILKIFQPLLLLLVFGQERQSSLTNVLVFFPSFSLLSPCSSTLLAILTNLLFCPFLPIQDRFSCKPMLAVFLKSFPLLSNNSECLPIFLHLSSFLSPRTFADVEGLDRSAVSKPRAALNEHLGGIDAC